MSEKLLTAKTWFILIQPEAALLRIAQTDDKCLDILNKAMDRFKTSLVFDDRTGTGSDNHFRIDLGDDTDAAEFFDVMLSTPEVLICSNKPVDLQIPSPTGKALELSNLKREFFLQAVPMKEMFMARTVENLRRNLKNLEAGRPADPSPFIH